MLDAQREDTHSQVTLRNLPPVRIGFAGIPLLAMGFIAGSLIGGGTSSDASNAAGVLIRDRLQVPALVIPKDGAAVIGASDDLFYLVRHDGSTAVLTGMSREDLCWRRPNER